MDKVGKGGAILLDATFRDGAGNLVNPVAVRLDIYNELGVLVVADLVPQNPSVGLFNYNYAVAANAGLGVWRVHWDGTINGVLVALDDYFEVVAAGSITFTSPMPWITTTEAQNVTGQALTEAQLINASYDVFAFMRWTPEYGTDIESDSDYDVYARRSLAHAIAWQAVFNLNNPPGKGMNRAVISRTVGRYSETFDASGTARNAVVPERVRSLLAGAGLLRWAGHSSPGPLDGASEAFIDVV